MHGTLMLRGNSNCLGFIELAAWMSMSMGLILIFLAAFPAGVEADLLFLVWGVTLLFLAYLQLWQSHSPVGMSFSSKGGSLQIQLLVALIFEASLNRLAL
jgi:hypothetical protein